MSVLIWDPDNERSCDRERALLPGGGLPPLPGDRQGLDSGREGRLPGLQGDRYVEAGPADGRGVDPGGEAAPRDALPWPLARLGPLTLWELESALIRRGWALKRREEQLEARWATAGTLLLWNLVVGAAFLAWLIIH